MSRRRITTLRLAAPLRVAACGPMLDTRGGTETPADTVAFLDVASAMRIRAGLHAANPNRTRPNAAFSSTAFFATYDGPCGPMKIDHASGATRQ